MLLIEARTGRPLEDLLRELYLEQGLDQRQIAEQLGTDRSAISRWMRALGVPARRRGFKAA